MGKRVLTEGEAAILTIIQEGYGPQLHTLDKVYFNATDDAVMFVRLANGYSVVMANLSLLSAWRAEGRIASDEELRIKYLRLKK